MFKTIGNAVKNGYRKIKSKASAAGQYVALGLMAGLGFLSTTIMPGKAFAVNALTTEATTQLGGLQTDVVALMTIMIGVVVTMAIGGIIFSIVKKK